MSNSRVAWLCADDPPEAFPDVCNALTEPDGLLAAGGDLESHRLLYAYSHGIFPWYEQGQPVLWWSPDPRCLFLKGDFHISRRWRRELRRSEAEIRTNTAFETVVRACAGPRRYEHGTWITEAMIEAYTRLHEEGWAHSIEVWENDKLIGGLYGILIGRAFFGESMYSHAQNASKAALLFLSRSLQTGALEILDCQIVSAHLSSMGARTLARDQFINVLETAVSPPEATMSWPAEPVRCPELLTI